MGERDRLIVEDDPALQVLFGDIAEAVGLKPLVVGTVAKGIEALKRDSFHDVFTDGHLPDGDCTKVIDAAREKGIPVYVFSSTKDGGLAQRIAESRDVPFTHKTDMTVDKLLEIF